MYCSECNLRIADDGITVCPVCQGPLQPDTVDETVSNAVTSENKSETSDIRVEDKFSAYEKPGQEPDFSPEKLGLESSIHKDPAGEDEDIEVLAELWEEEDINDDLEGVLAEAFSLDEVSDIIETKDGMDQEEDDSDLGDAFKPGKSEVLPVPPPVEPPSQSRSLWLLLLLVFVIGAGGGIWFYMQKPKATSGERVVRSVAKPQPVKAAPLLPVKETVTAEKAANTESITAAGVNAVDEKTGELATSIPVKAEAVVKVTDLKEKGSETLSQEVKATLSPSSVESTVKPAKESETQEVLLAVTEEKTSFAAKVPAESDVKAVAKTKLPASSPDSSSQEGVGRKSAKIVKAAVGKTEASLTSPYAVHVGSFKSQKRAARQVAKLQEKGFVSYSVKVDLKDKGVWQRVLIPGGTNRREAKVVQEKFAEFFPKEDSRILKIKK